MNEALLGILLDGGTLAVFVIFVLYMGQQQAKERSTLSDERKENSKVLLQVLTDERERADNQMQVGLNGLDKVVVSIEGLTAANAELSKVIAVHDNKSDGKMERVLDRLESIKNGG